MEKMSMTGAPPGPLIWGPDAIMGALFGAGTFVFGDFFVPWFAHCIRRNFKVIPLQVDGRSNCEGNSTYGSSGC